MRSPYAEAPEPCKGQKLQIREQWGDYPETSAGGNRSGSCHPLRDISYSLDVPNLGTSAIGRKKQSRLAISVLARGDDQGRFRRRNIEPSCSDCSERTPSACHVFSSLAISGANLSVVRAVYISRYSSLKMHITTTACTQQCITLPYDHLQIFLEISNCGTISSEGLQLTTGPSFSTSHDSTLAHLH